MAFCSHGKIPFATQREALRTISGMRARGQNGTQSHAYLCSECGAWHITSQSPKDRGRRAERARQAFGYRPTRRQQHEEERE